ncbi:MAG: hypothetical protein ACLR3C_06875 [Eggerthella lenta]
MLRASLKAAAPKEMAGLAREYRATVEAIERMEGTRMTKRRPQSTPSPSPSRRMPS